MGLRILGLNPSEAEIKKFIETVDDTPNPSLDFKDFNNIYNICKEESKMTADLVRQYL